MITGAQPYQIANEFNIADLLAHLDAQTIYDILDDKLNNISFSKTTIESNIVGAFAITFQQMNDQFSGDSQNIKSISVEVYRTIIEKLTKSFNLEFNYADDTIDLYTAAYYLYDFLVCNRNNNMINFFVSFIVNNKDVIYNGLGEDAKKIKDSSINYSKRIYADSKYAAISANIKTVIENISTMDIRLGNIFQSTYRDPNLVLFLDNAFADRGDFFKNYYCNIIRNQEELPIIITDIRLALQRIVGDISGDSIRQYLSYIGGNN